SVALCTEDMLSGEYTWQVGNNHSVELLERIQRLVTECGRSMQSIEAIAVANGPGSFNGLRVAVATAKALAFALRVPLVGISTLDIIAAQQQQWRGPICAALEAGRGELYAACYIFNESVAEGQLTYNMCRLSDYLLDALPQLKDYLLAHLSEWAGVPGERRLPPILFCGELSETSRAALSEQLPGSVFLAPIQSARHAATLATLAFQRFHHGVVDDPLLLEPLYLRRPSITTSARKQPLLGGKTHRSSDLAQTERGEGALHH
ncbi:MAG TPA: tRNA (adenosine(37)-N6)-threonylcarbamoyltransferase complex dimerization subunit type 1 TsaB, partial [Ktedonobacteraceae bacterium]|nr:tRNA (adenosine(37)-N6)-threonylcarbamoyltransferase complex dimerization subunit type 1 TsaB [Ktedonobacteraceae bacterium]